jgi:DNA polymerase III epsilon subunit-like protein
MRVGVWEEEAAFETFVRPRQRVPSFITGLTGITQADVAGAQMWRRLQVEGDGCPVEVKSAVIPVLD